MHREMLQILDPDAMAGGQMWILPYVFLLTEVLAKVFVAPRFRMVPGPGEIGPLSLTGKDVQFIVAWFLLGIRDEQAVSASCQV